MLTSFSSKSFALCLTLVWVNSLFVCIFASGCSGVASLENAVHVKNEEELRNAVMNASSIESVVIALDNDIVFTDFARLRIPANSDVTLTSSKTTGYYKILRSITVESGGVLNIDGVIITNEPVGAGGVEVKRGGLLILCSGEISDNSLNGSLDSFVHAYGGGVCNYGVFKMYGGEISGNVVNGEIASGGGVYNAYQSSFVMSGGVNSDNTAIRGGGVYNLGSFNMSGGEIVDNKGGGVVTSGYGVFDRTVGVNSDNTDYDVYSNDSNGSTDGIAD
jgi:hypothetical protein